MDPIRLLARSALAGIFITGGLDALRNPAPRAKLAEPVTTKARESASFLPDDDETLVRINAGVHIAAGTLLALGKFRRVSALVLAGSLIPTTAGGHRFWEAEGQQRSQQQAHFFKNAAIFGGLIYAALDRGGDPSLAWRAKHLASDAVSGVGDKLPVG